MTILDEGTIDMVSVSGEEVVLRVIDHLDWTDENDHLYKLQEKMNGYIEFVESGQIYEVKESYRDKKIVVCVALKFSYPSSVEFFFKGVEELLHKNGIIFRVDVG